MEALTDVKDVGFDLEKAGRIVAAYSQSTGVECFVIDSRGRTLDETGKKANHCSHCRFCTNYHTISDNKASCETVHRYGSYQAERFGGRYIFFCPVGLTHWASPISSKSGVAGAIIGGPVLMVDPEQFMLGDLMEEGGIDRQQVEKLKEYVMEIPVIDTDVVDSLSELLSILAEGISAKGTLNSNEQKEFNEVHADIAESINYMKLIKDDEDEKINYPFEKEKDLLYSISSGDKQTAQKILNEILGDVFFSSGKDFNIIKAHVIELVVLLSRAAMEGGADSEVIFGLNYKYLKDVGNINNVDELTFWLSKILDRFTDCVFNFADIRHSDVIHKALDYIRNNYNDRISLEDVARQVYMNPSYFSKIFKNEMKSSFVTYVTKLRIDVSKRLLSDISIPITEVSSLAGFDDQSYFTKVFKKTTGMTPGKFRKLRGKQPEANV